MAKEKYDIIFIYAFSRSHPYLLNIIKYLKNDFRIGVAMLDVEEYTSHANHPKRVSKLRNTESDFLGLCEKLGADIIYLDGKKEARYTANLLLIPQTPRSDEGFRLISELVEYRTAVGLQGFGYGQLMMDVLYGFGCRKFFVYDRAVFERVLKDEGRADILSKFEIREMGEPYLKYPLWDEREAGPMDYLIAFPSGMLLGDTEAKLNLMKDIFSFIGKTDAGDKILVKLHNVRDGGNLYVRKIAPAPLLLADIAGSFGAKGRAMAAGIYFGNISKKAKPLSSVTPYYNFGLELFLPQVRKGVITGISSVIWHCLYNKIPVYNCDRQELSCEIPNHHVYKNFYVPPCKGNRYFDSLNFNKVSDSARSADMIEMIKEEAG